MKRFPNLFAALRSRILLVLLILSFNPRPAFAQSFSAKNVIDGQARLILDHTGNPLSAKYGMVEILDGTVLLARGPLVSDGLFFLGSVVDSAACCGSATLTLRAWDSRWGQTYETASTEGIDF
jgi:hypothetical protein